MDSTSGESAVDERKRKRMLSNRESARRSRQRKQKHLDDLAAQVSGLREENARIVAALSLTTQQYLGVEAHNSVLRAQMAELSSRLQGLNQILSLSCCVNDDGGGDDLGDDDMMMMMMMRPASSSWGMMVMNDNNNNNNVDRYQYC